MLPSTLPPQPALVDIDTTPEQLAAAQKLAKVTTPQETPIFICGLQLDSKTSVCNRLFPSRDRVMVHRKRDHNSDDTANIITWNE